MSNKIYTLTVITAFSVATAAGCASDDETIDPIDDETPEEPQQVTDCVEDDFQTSPFGGPGFDPDTGLIGERQATYVASTTHVLLIPEKTNDFFGLAGAVVADLPNHEGFIGYALGSSDKCGTARTLTLWSSEEAMYSFATDDVHMDAVSRSQEVSASGVVTHWEISGESVPPTWDEAFAEAAATEVLY
ncbi:MAG: hypothetical protein AAGC55_15200 [Myxococcota bacterium]